MSAAAARRLALAALCALGAFSLVFTQVAQEGRWPATPSGFLHDIDLWAGLAAGAVWLAILLRPPRFETSRGGRSSLSDTSPTPDTWHLTR